jgi:hypothetical protein
LEGQSFWTWSKASSTGVSRPKIETSTLSFCWSALISEMDPGSCANGPEVTVTDSPTCHSTCGLSFSTGLVSRILATSFSDSGVGLAPEPTKPVTPGV